MKKAIICSTCILIILFNHYNNIPFLKVGGIIIALIKPQFEVGKGQVGKGGIVRDEAAREAAVEKVRIAFQNAGLEVKGIIPSPITGQDGNVEFLMHAVRHA